MNLHHRLGIAVLAVATVSAPVAFAEDTQVIDEVVVTGTREKQLKSETPATIDSVSGESIRETHPTHPSAIMNQMPGVWVSVTGGEGHQTAIRQPLTTSPVYLYLEDGVPTRATGFFNHNALYEINIPQASGIEVNKGPGTALYGSDAIGGVINVMTRPAPLAPEADITLETGEFGWRRLLVSGGDGSGTGGVRADLNLTQTDGWRDATAYDRNSGTVRWDRALGDNATLKTVATYSEIDQQTAGTSTLSRSDYENDPTINYTPISFRKVKAFRLSAAYEQEAGGSLLSLTPYYRNNDMQLLANWSLGYDPTVYDTFNQSFGVLAKYRRDFEPYRARLIAGIDVDRSPGGRDEKAITTTKSGNIYTSYAEGQTLYNYDVTYQGVSPYLHGEISPSDRLRLTAGLRYDDIRYDYDNKLADSAIQTTATRFYGHVGDTTLSFSHTSPKLGATYAFSPSLSGFAVYNHTFRAPSEGQLFRPGTGSNATNAQISAEAAAGLKPIKADNYELGLRGKAGTTNYEVSVYRMTKTDDIVSYQAPSASLPNPNPRVNQNAGQTLHRGIELGLGAELATTLRLEVSYSHTRHTYGDWISNTTDFSGKEMEAAPRNIGNVRLAHSPVILNGGKVSLERVSLGRYWIDPLNTAQYEGHDLLNLRANYPVSHEWELFGSITNMADKRYADSTGQGPVYAPGLPRTYYVGVRYQWKPAAGTAPTTP